VAVLVVTVRAIKAHSGRFRVIPGRPMDSRIHEPDVEAVRQGLPNMVKHLENIARFNLPCVVAINRFPTDTDEELAALADAAREAGAFEVALSEVHTRGGDGGQALAEAVARAAETPAAKPFRLLYELKTPIKAKIETIAREIYGADGVPYEAAANAAAETLTRLGFDKLPICMAKTQYSLSHDPARKGRPTGFVLPVRDIRLAGGAGFLTPLVGTIQTMPAFGRHPAALDMDIDDEGRVIGLF
jgi:formyltetrahydrofolate synthetase